MARYSLKLPEKLKTEAEDWANVQGISLNQFIMWAVAEKVGALRQSLDDSAFPKVTYRRGSSGVPSPAIRGTGIRVQTVVLASKKWKLSRKRIADEYDLTASQVDEALAFYAKHKEEIDLAIRAEEGLEAAHG